MYGVEEEEMTIKNTYKLTMETQRESKDIPQATKDLLTIAKLSPYQFFPKELDDSPHSSSKSHSTTHPQHMLSLHCDLQQAI